MINKTYAMMSIVILIASLVGIGFATSTLMGKLHEKEQSDAELRQAQIDFAQAQKDYNDYVSGTENEK